MMKRSMQKTVLGAFAAASLPSTGCTNLPEFSDFARYPGTQSEECAQFMECNDTWAAEMEFEPQDWDANLGVSGDCWTISPEESANCTSACLDMIRAIQSSAESNEAALPQECLRVSDGVKIP
ncbi:MAG: hypothetical protein GY822_11985 [Deltaproteobacteria bacterium]|nr:hypothetical protein [Deltaproteobacteria bacterium]